MKRSTKILVIVHIATASIIFLIALILLSRFLLCTTPEGNVLTDEFLIQDCSRSFLRTHALCCLGAAAVLITGAGLSVFLNGYKSYDLPTCSLPWRILAIVLAFGAAALLVIYPIHGTTSVFKYSPVVTEIPIKDKYCTVDYDDDGDPHYTYYIVQDSGSTNVARQRMYDAAEPGYSVYTASFDGEILGVYSGRTYRLPSSS